MAELVATLVAGKIDLSHALAARLGQEFKTSPVWLAPGKAFDLFIEAQSTGHLRAALQNFLKGEAIDIIVQPVANRRKKLLIADMESTIIEQELLDELAALIGLRKKMTDIGYRTMNGELDFAASLRERVRLLQGRPQSFLDQAARTISYMPGAEKLLKVMKANGAACWLATGGFTYFAEPLAKKLGFDQFHANRFIIESGVLTGHVEDPILDRESKKELLLRACGELNLTPADCLAVGDGGNDLAMLTACNQGGGLGIAYHAKPKVREAVAHQINHADLTALLYAQGYAA